jgi:hypothetical protein
MQEIVRSGLLSVLGKAVAVNVRVIPSRGHDGSSCLAKRVEQRKRARRSVYLLRRV